MEAVYSVKTDDTGDTGLLERKDINMEEMFATEGVTRSNRLLHTPESFAKNNLLYVQETGTLKSLAPHVCRRENLDSYLIFQVLNGKGSITYEGDATTIRKGECIWIDCHRAFEHISSEDDPWELAWVHYNGKCAEEFYRLFRGKNRTPVFTPTDSEKIYGLIETLSFYIKENISELRIHSALTQLLVECITQTVHHKDIMKEIRDFININFAKNNLYELLTKHFRLSKEKLEELFVTNYGIELRDYIIRRKFNAAKELLRFTIDPMDLVIQKSGIGIEDLFYQLFKENEAMSPEDYRRNWAQWIKD